MTIYAAGNDAYAMHQAGYHKDKRPNISVEETEIPALRKSFYTLLADGNLNALLHIAQRNLPSLIDSFGIFCFKTHLDRQSELEAIVLQPRKSMPQILERLRVKLKENTRTLVIDPMAASETEWISKARKLCRHWAEK